MPPKSLQQIAKSANIKPVTTQYSVYGTPYDVSPIPKSSTATLVNVPAQPQQPVTPVAPSGGFFGAIVDGAKSVANAVIDVATGEAPGAKEPEKPVWLYGRAVLDDKGELVSNLAPNTLNAQLANQKSRLNEAPKRLKAIPGITLQTPKKVEEIAAQNLQFANMDPARRELLNRAYYPDTRVIPAPPPGDPLKVGAFAPSTPYRVNGKVQGYDQYINQYNSIGDKMDDFIHEKTGRSYEDVTLVLWVICLGMSIAGVAQQTFAPSDIRGAGGLFLIYALSLMFVNDHSIVHKIGGLFFALLGIVLVATPTLSAEQMHNIHGCAIAGELFMLLLHLFG